MTPAELKQLENDLWSAADNLRANSDLKSSVYSTPVLGLIFLNYTSERRENSLRPNLCAPALAELCRAE